MAKKYGKKPAFPASKFGKAISGGVNSFSILFLHCLNQWFHKFQASKPKKNWQLSTGTDVSAAENQRRVDSQLKLWWWCSLRIDQGVYHLLNASILWGTLSGFWMKEKGQKWVFCPAKKCYRNFGVLADFFSKYHIFVSKRTLFVGHQKNKTTLMIDPFQKKHTTFLWGGAFGCLPHHQHRDSSAFFRWKLSPRHGN